MVIPYELSEAAPFLSRSSYEMAWSQLSPNKGMSLAVARSSYIGNCIFCYNFKKYGYLNSAHFMLKSISEKFKWSISIEWCPSILGQFLHGEDTNGKKGNMWSSIFSLVTKVRKYVMVWVAPLQRKIWKKCWGYFLTSPIIYIVRWCENSAELDCFTLANLERELQPLKPAYFFIPHPLRFSNFGQMSW